MKISSRQPGKFRPAIGGIVMALAFASATGGMTVSSALGQTDDSRARQAQDRDRDDRNQTCDRNRDDRGEPLEHPPVNQDADRRSRPGAEDPDRYSQPVYAPPPVYFYPEPRITLQSPGIRLFVPLDVR